MYLHFRNKFNFSDIHQSVNAMGLMQSEKCPMGITLTLHKKHLLSYVDEHQNNKFHLFYLHFIFISTLFIIWDILKNIL